MREDHEGDRDRPVHDALDQGEALDHPAGRRMRAARSFRARGRTRAARGASAPTRKPPAVAIGTRTARHVWPSDWMRTFVSRPGRLVVCGIPERISFHTGALLIGCVCCRCCCCCARSAAARIGRGRLRERPRQASTQPAGRRRRQGTCYACAYLSSGASRRSACTRSATAGACRIARSQSSLLLLNGAFAYGGVSGLPW